MTSWTARIDSFKGSRYLAIANAIEAAVKARELHPGQRLPTHRGLAHQLKLSVQTISLGYSEAERRGLVFAEPGRGTFVQFVTPENKPNYIADDNSASALDFSNIVPLVSEEHVKAITSAFDNLANGKAASRMLAYRPTAGVEFHRQAGAQWIEQNGLSAEVKDVVVTNSSLQGVLLAITSVAEPGDVIAVDSLVDSGVIAIASMLRLKLYPLNIDGEGILPESFKEACSKNTIKAIFTIPCYSVPTVSLMTEKRRKKIAEIARRYKVIIIESDDWGPLIPNRPKPLAYFAPELSFYATSLAQITTASQRVGYLCSPRHLLPRILSRLRIFGWITSPWAAEVAAMWIYDGTLQKLVNWQRERLKSRHAMFKQIMTGYQYSQHSYSLHCWISLPSQWRSRPFVDQAKRNGILVTPPDPYVVGRSQEPHAIRLAIGGAIGDDKDFKRGLEILAEMMKLDPEFVDEVGMNP